MDHTAADDISHQANAWFALFHGGAPTPEQRAAWSAWMAADVRHAQAYAFVHNESVRLMNTGLNAVEIGEAIKLPEPLAKAWFNRPNYGSLKFNARAVYQRYLGAFDGDPATLDPLPRADLAPRLVAQMGGPKKVLAAGKATAAIAEVANESATPQVTISPVSLPAERNKWVFRTPQQNSVMAADKAPLPSTTDKPSGMAERMTRDT